MSTSRIGVVGAGYVGLTTAACMASLGHDVVCGDVDAVKLAALSRGDVPILEPGLSELVQEGTRSGRLSFVLGAAAASQGRDFVFLCVPTPPAPDAQNPRLRLPDLPSHDRSRAEISAHRVLPGRP